MDHPIYRRRRKPFNLLRGFKKGRLYTLGYTACLLFVTSTTFWLAGCQQEEARQQSTATAAEKVIFATDGAGNTSVRANGYEMNLDAGKMDIRVEGTTQPLAIHFENASGISAPAQPSERLDERIYDELYEKTDLRIYDKGNGNAAYDFILEPGADPEKICMKLEGEKEGSSGQWGAGTAAGGWRPTAPYGAHCLSGDRR